MEALYVAVISALGSILVAVATGLLVRRKNSADAMHLIAEADRDKAEVLVQVIEQLRTENQRLCQNRDKADEKIAGLTKQRDNALRLLRYVLDAPLGEERTRLDRVAQRLQLAAEDANE